jgi:hypothetical protein
LAGELGTPESTLQDIMNNSKKDHGFRRHSSALKPALTEGNKHERVLWAVSKIDMDAGRFELMEDEIHVDEKWFYLTQNNASFILLDEEEDPHRTVKHKSHVDKVMFLAATAKPRWDPARNQHFDGKLGIWPFAKQEAAKRASANRPKGTMEWKTSTVDREACKSVLLDNLLPSILALWPAGAGNKVIKMQQDSAPLHVEPDDEDWLAAVANTGLDVELINQPPNSPDTNVNDLGFFNSIQTLQHKIGSGTNKGSLIAAVNQAHHDHPWRKIRDVFLTLQSCLNCIIENHGGNDCKVPHVSKEKLEREGLLPLSLQATAEAAAFLQDDESQQEPPHNNQPESP